MVLRLLVATIGATFLFAADEAPQYEMTSYAMGLLRKGPNYTSGTKEENAALMAGHLANIQRMADLGKLAVAGPFGDSGDIRGILVFHGATLEEARHLVDADPAVKSGHLVLEMHPRYAAAGLHVNPPKGFIEENDVEYSRPDGKPLTLDLRVPDSKALSPAVIIVHGGGFSGGNKRMFVTPLFNLLSAAGFGWFSIDYRLAPEFRLPQAAADLADAIRWVRANAARYHVDAGRLVLVGESAGGYLAAYAGVHANGDTSLRAVVDFYGPNDLALHTEKRRSQPDDPAKPEPPGLKQFLGFKTWRDPGVMERLRAESPVAHAHRGMPPFLFLHGTGDTVVPYEQSPRMCGAMKTVGAVCDVVTIERGAHGMGNWDHDSSTAQWRTDLVAWLKKITE